MRRASALRPLAPLRPTGTPARRAFERPMAIACFTLRAPCSPVRTSSISLRTNSPATVLADLPSRALRRARWTTRFSGMGFPSVKIPELPFGGIEHLALRRRQVLAAAVDVEIQHRHRGPERRTLAAMAPLRPRGRARRSCACRAQTSDAAFLALP